MRYEVQWLAEYGTWENPGGREESTFETRGEAERAIASLCEDEDWRDAKFRVVVVRRER